MKVLVDTSVWSLALRRHQPAGKEPAALAALLRNGSVALLGVVRQEVLSGIPDERLFLRLRDQLRVVPNHPLDTRHYEAAAEAFNLCRRRGVQGSLVDFLLCAAAATDGLPLYTTDQDFALYAKHLPIKFFSPA
jgi:predicted nucleic acid-binding protein